MSDHLTTLPASTGPRIAHIRGLAPTGALTPWRCRVGPRERRRDVMDLIDVAARRSLVKARLQGRPNVRQQPHGHSPSGKDMWTTVAPTPWRRASRRRVVLRRLRCCIRLRRGCRRYGPFPSQLSSVAPVRTHTGPAASARWAWVMCSWQRPHPSCCWSRGRAGAGDAAVRRLLRQRKGLAPDRGRRSHREERALAGVLRRG
jgi:hypothetical protein